MRAAYVRPDERRYKGLSVERLREIATALCEAGGPFLDDHLAIINREIAMRGPR